MGDLGCFVVALAKEGGGKTAMVIIDRDEDEARRTAIDYCDWQGVDAKVVGVVEVPMIEGRYVDLASFAVGQP